MNDEQLEGRFQQLEHGLSEEFKALHVAIARGEATSKGEAKRLDSRFCDHAKANREQHEDLRTGIKTAIDGAHGRIDGVDDRIDGVNERVNTIDRDTAVNKARVGLWGFLGGGSFLAAVQALKHLVLRINGGG